MRVLRKDHGEPVRTNNGFKKFGITGAGSTRRLRLPPASQNQCNPSSSNGKYLARHIVASLSFWGGVGTVTGSKYLIENNDTRVLVDCGMFQGLKELRERNWQPPPFDPRSLDAILITHAHIDHTGYLPRVV